MSVQQRVLRARFLVRSEVADVRCPFLRGEVAAGDGTRRARPVLRVEVPEHRTEVVAVVADGSLQTVGTQVDLDRVIVTELQRISEPYAAGDVVERDRPVVGAGQEDAAVR